jgi:hypothetical protein
VTIDKPHKKTERKSESERHAGYSITVSDLSTTRAGFMRWAVSFAPPQSRNRSQRVN